MGEPVQEKPQAVAFLWSSELLAKALMEHALFAHMLARTSLAAACWCHFQPWWPQEHHTFDAQSAAIVTIYSLPGYTKIRLGSSFTACVWGNKPCVPPVLVLKWCHYSLWHWIRAQSAP